MGTVNAQFPSHNGNTVSGSFILDLCIKHERILFYFAGVAELVDALDSGSSVHKDVRVQVSPSAPLFFIYCIEDLF